MKKMILAGVFGALLLVGCNTTETVEKEQPTAQQPETLILYKSNADADAVMPFEVAYNGTDSGLVDFIFDEVAEFEVGLLNYTFEDEGKGLVLNLDDNIFNVQGSAGGNMFAQTLTHSYFEHFPELQQVTFIHDGSYEQILDHLQVGEPYTRDALNK